MRIKKTSETTPTMASIVDSYSTSTQDGYSCNYVNECNSYSTSETLTGKKWINNKPIYRKVVQITMTEQQTGTPTNISNLDIVTFFGGITDDGLPINFDFKNVFYISTFMDTGVIYNTCSSGYVDKHAYITIEYTKTTD